MISQDLGIIIKKESGEQTSLSKYDFKSKDKVMSEVDEMLKNLDESAV